jgi:DNA-binding FadR family transcriptional regulator
MSKLVDKVEEDLLKYFRTNGLKAGDGIPNEVELSERLGIARTVLREALSRFKMSGMIECRTKRGMVLASPKPFMGLKAAMIPELMEEEELSDLLGMRVALEVGLAPLISANATDGMISQLESIVETAERFKDAKYAPMSDYSFHSKLWEIAGNSQAEEFEKETYPLVEYADLHFADRLDLNRRRLESARQCPGHRELVDLLHKGEPEPFRKALAAHLKVYELRD